MNIRIKISVILLLLGAILTFLPSADHFSLHGKPDQLLLSALDDTNYLTADEVARALVDEDKSLQYIDLRTPEEFKKANIPGSLNIPYTDFLSADLETYLNSGARIIFYANDDYKPNYALILARGIGYNNCYVLKGGMKSWYSNIMNSEFTGDKISPRENALYETRYKARKIFSDINSMPDSLKDKYMAAKEIERKKLDGGCE
jgi:rhodanese-related sulfurtransferase